MTASRTDTGAAMQARKRVRAWVTKPDGSRSGELILDVRHAWDVLDELKAERLIPDDDYDISVRRQVESGDAG